MKVWILVPKKALFTSYANLRYIEEAKKNGIDCQLIATEDIDIVINRDDLKSVLFEGKRIDMPDVIIPRAGSAATYFTLSLIRHFDRMGVFMPNTASSIAKAKDKLHSLQVLESKNIPIPKTVLAKSPINPDLLEKEFGFPFVLKKVTGSQGKGVLLIKSKQQLEDILGLIDEGQQDGQNLIFQEFVKFSKGRDIRVIVIGGRAIGAMQRIAKPGDFRSNFKAGGSVENFEITPEVEWLAVETAKALNLGICGVDILFDEDGYKICEVNANPQFEGFEKSTGINVPQEVFDFLKVRF